jgi:hypothetical protein
MAYAKVDHNILQKQNWQKMCRRRKNVYTSQQAVGKGQKRRAAAPANHLNARKFEPFSGRRS